MYKNNEAIKYAGSWNENANFKSTLYLSMIMDLNPGDKVSFFLDNFSHYRGWSSKNDNGLKYVTKSQVCLIFWLVLLQITNISSF